MQDPRFLHSMTHVGKDVFVMGGFNRGAKASVEKMILSQSSCTRLSYGSDIEAISGASY